MQKRLGLDLEVPDEFGWMMAGYVTGEGHFGALIGHKREYRNLQLRFEFGIRADDLPGLEYIRDTLGVGDISREKRPKENQADAVRYRVGRIGDLYHVIVPLFEKYPLPAQWHKSREFDIWKQLVYIAYHEGGPKSRGYGGGAFPLPQSYWDKVEPLIAELKGIRHFSLAGKEVRK